MHGPTLSHDTHTLAHRLVHISLCTHIDKTTLPCAHLQMQTSAIIGSLVQRGLNSPTGPGQLRVEFIDFLMSIKRFYGNPGPKTCESQCEDQGTLENILCLLKLR